ncbi:MAG: hypothetical protein ABII76_18580 [Pseudomonadota bacterium]
MSAEQDTGWRWWGGYQEEWCVYGPYLTRDEVIVEAQEDALGEFQAEDGTWKIGVFIWGIIYLTPSPFLTRFCP